MSMLAGASWGTSSTPAPCRVVIAGALLGLSLALGCGGGASANPDGGDRGGSSGSGGGAGEIGRGGSGVAGTGAPGGQAGATSAGGTAGTAGAPAGRRAQPDPAEQRDSRPRPRRHQRRHRPGGCRWPRGRGRIRRRLHPEAMERLRSIDRWLHHLSPPLVDDRPRRRNRQAVDRRGQPAGQRAHRGGLRRADRRDREVLALEDGQGRRRPAR